MGYLTVYVDNYETDPSLQGEEVQIDYCLKNGKSNQPVRVTEHKKLTEMFCWRFFLHEAELSFNPMNLVKSFGKTQFNLMTHEVSSSLTEGLCLVKNTNVVIRRFHSKSAFFY